MAVTPTVRNEDEGLLVTWAIVHGNLTGTGVQLTGWSDRTVQFVAGAGDGFGAGTYHLEGSNDSTNGADGTWTVLTDPQGNAISKTSGAIEAVTELPRWVRARGASTDANDAVNVYLFCSRSGR